MAIDLTELYKQRQAIDAEIKTLREQAVREGEVIVIDGVTIDSTIDVDGEMQNPVETDYFFTYRKDDNGDIIDQGEITYKDLIDRFGQGISGKEDEAIQAIEDATEENKTELDTYAEGIKTESLDPLVERAETAATNAEASEQGAETAYNNTVAAKDEAVEAINTEEQSALSAIDSAKESALDAIGESDTEGARGQAVTSITEKVAAFDKKIAQDNSEWDAKVVEALQNLQDTLAAALAAIGESDTEGARGNAITSITNALNSALIAIGRTDDEGARKEVLDAVNLALTNALAAIGQTDSGGARGEAISSINEKITAFNEKVVQDNSAWDSKVQSDNAAFDAKVNEANTTIDGKVAEATNQAATAAEKASEATQSAVNAKVSEEAAKTSETAAAGSATNAKNSETNAKNSETAAKASENAAKTSETAAEASKNAAASSASNAAASETNAKTSETAAKSSENAAASSEALAKKWAENPVDEPVTGEGDTAEYSAKYWAEKAKEAVNSPLATETVYGRVRLMTYDETLALLQQWEEDANA